MAVVDSLLNLIAAQRAEGLLISSDQAPRLIFGDEERPLSMPPIPTATVEDFAREVQATGDRDGGGESASQRYSTDAGQEYDVRVEGKGENLRLLFRPAGLESAADGPAASPEPGLTTKGTPGNSPPAPEPEAIALDARLLDWLNRIERKGASDLILSSGASARMRVGGVLQELPGAALSDDDILALFASAMNEPARERLDTHGSVDLAIEMGVAGIPARFRVNIFKQQRGVVAALRPIRQNPPSLLDLKLPKELHELVEYRNGLVLVTGPTGSGTHELTAAGRDANALFIEQND